MVVCPPGESARRCIAPYRPPVVLDVHHQLQHHLGALGQPAATPAISRCPLSPRPGCCLVDGHHKVLMGDLGLKMSSALIVCRADYLCQIPMMRRHMQCAATFSRTFIAAGSSALNCKPAAFSSVDRIDTSCSRNLMWAVIWVVRLVTHCIYI